MGQLPRLHRIFLGGNLFTELPSVLCSLPLFELDINSCRRESAKEKGAQTPQPFSLPPTETLRGLSLLEALRLDGTRLATLPDYIALLPRLAVLNAANNNLQAVCRPLYSRALGRSLAIEAGGNLRLRSSCCGRAPVRLRHNLCVRALDILLLSLTQRARYESQPLSCHATQWTHSCRSSRSRARRR